LPAGAAAPLRALRFLIGAAAGFLVWWYGALVYNGALSFAAERVLQFDQRLCGPHLIADDRRVYVSPRLCVVPDAMIPADQLTYNMILFAALFAMRFRNALSFVASLLALIVTHVLLLALSVETTYAQNGGKFSPLESNIWTGAEFWWRLVGMFAFVFVMWWLTLESTPLAPRSTAAQRPKRAAARGRR
jgi:hypothetical protein